MASSQLIEAHRENAEVYTGEEMCRIKTMDLFEKISMPKGLIPMNNVTEVGYNESTGFVWLKRSKKVDHKFTKIGRNVAYDTEVTAFVEDRRMKKLTGVKSKELFIWVTINDISINDPNSGKITFGTPTGISRSFPVAAFEEVEKDEKK